MAQNSTKPKNQAEIELPNKHVKRIWPELYKKILAEVNFKKESLTSEEIRVKSKIPLEERVRELLTKTFKAEKIEIKPAHQKFFKQVVRHAVNIDLENSDARLKGGRDHFGQNRHSKGKIRPNDEFLPEEIS